MADDLVAALTQVVGGGAGGGLEGRDSLLFLMAPLGAGERFMLKDQEESPGDGLAGTQLADQAQIVLLKHPAVGVGLPLQRTACTWRSMSARLVSTLNCTFTGAIFR